MQAHKLEMQLCVIDFANVLQAHGLNIQFTNLHKINFVWSFDLFLYYFTPLSYENSNKPVTEGVSLTPLIKYPSPCHFGSWFDYLGNSSS
jgi:hypothetical protein